MPIPLIIIIGMLVDLIGLVAVGAIFYFKKEYFKRFYHDVLKWHTPKNDISSFDGCSFHHRCKHCGKEIMQDSQGNWVERR